MKHKCNGAEKEKRNRIFQNFIKLPKRKKAGLVTAALLTLATLITVPTLAWFSYQRKMGDMQYVDSPTKLYITAAHGEEIKYFDIADIQVTKSDETSKYYVFAVSGSNAASYNLQLAFTTNNQFEYYLYPATEHVGVPDSETETPHPTYISHTDEGTGTNYYYTINKSILVNPSGTAPHAAADYRIVNGTQISRRDTTLTVTSEYLNKTNPIPPGAVIDANTTKHNDTYSTYSVVQDCAEPIYWQIRNIKSDMDPTTRELLDYYILEVSWANIKAITPSGEFIDNGETDIIYISVDSGS